MFEHFDKCHTLTQILRRFVDEPHVMDNLPPLAASLSVQQGILVAFVSEYWLNVENRHGTCHKNALIQSKSILPPNSKIDICIRGNPYRVLDTSEAK